MAVDLKDFVYAGLLVLSVALGYFIRHVKAGFTRKLASFLAGVLMVTIICGFHGLHSLVIVLGNALIVLHITPRLCHIVSFAWCFGYLLFFRTTQYFGLPEVPQHADATQLLLTLKLVGLAFEVADSHKNKVKQAKAEDDEFLQLESEYRSIKPGFVDMVLYSYCYVGVLTGPYYNYRTYDDMMESKSCHKIDTWEHIVPRLKWLPAVSVLYLLVNFNFGVQDMISPEFAEYPIYWRILYTSPVFFAFRLRVYWAWLMAEIMCITATLGAYPTKSKPQNGLGPTDLVALKQSEKEDPEKVEYSFRTIEQLDIWLVETIPSFRGTMKVWNMTVQSWLVHFVFKRFPIKSLRTIATLGTSAYWHGIHWGYYSAFLTMACGMFAEDSMKAAFRKDLSEQGQKRFDWIWWIIHVRIYEYMSSAFLLLSSQNGITYWKSVYFYGHFCILFFAMLGQTVVFLKKKRKAARKHVDNHVNNNVKISNGKYE